MPSTLTIVIVINQVDTQSGAYPVQLWHDGKPLAEVQARIDRQALLQHEHHFSAQDYGMELHDALFAGQVGDEYRRLVGRADVDAFVRVQLVIAEQASELHALPWERLFHRFGNSATPLAATAQTPFSRFLITGAGDQPPIKARPLRLLLAIANPWNLPSGLAEVDGVGEVTALADLLAGLRGRLVGTVLPGRSGLPAQLRQRLEQEGWSLAKSDEVTSLDNIQRHLPGHQLLHILAHGQFKQSDGQAYLLLEGEGASGAARGSVQRVADQEIVDGLAGVHPPPQLVFLAACESAKRPMDAANPFVGLGPKLVLAGVPAVVAMQDLISIDIAHSVAGDFYRRLFDHGHVDRALNEARALVFQRDQFSWAIPALFLRLRDGWLINTADFQPKPLCPFPGMRAFKQEESRLFFGRDDEIAEIRRRLHAEPLVVVIGTSGCGKSSLIAAGLLPKLDEQEWTVRRIEPGTRPQQQLRTQLTDLFDFEGGRRLDKRSTKLLLVVDQLEQVFASAVEQQERDSFIELLLRLTAAPGLKVVLTVRSDFYEELMASNLRSAVQSRLLYIALPDDDNLRDAIIKPAAAVDVEVEPSLVERLVTEAGHEPGVLPFIQETLVLLWQDMEGRKLTLADYDDLVESAQRAGSAAKSGLQVAMANQASAAFNDLEPNEQRIARHILLRLIELSDVERLTRRQQTEDELVTGHDDIDTVRHVLEHLGEHRLITLGEDKADGSRSVDLCHEALVHGWSSLEKWVIENRDAELMCREVERAAAVWQQEGRGLRSSYLYRGRQLSLAQAWAKTHPDDISSRVDAFLASSQRRVHTERAAEAVVGLILVLALSASLAHRLQNLLWQKQSRGPVVLLTDGLAVLGDEATPATPPDAMLPEEPFPRLFPRTEVSFASFTIDQYEVSYDRFRLCVRAGACSRSDNDPEFDTRDGRLPVVNVTAFQANSFCRWLGGQLPTEVEWERTVRGLEGRPWPWGDDPPTPDRANLAIDGYFGQELGKPVAVDDPFFARGATAAPEAGILHLLGNVAEWTRTPLDCAHTPYQCQDPWDGVSPVDSLFIRGMSYRDQLIPGDLNYGLNYSALFTPDFSADDVGFRCAFVTQEGGQP